MHDQGIGVLIVSAEVNKIIALLDHIAVMYRGKIVTILFAGEVTASN
jgi:ABC-type uncharacterized transport system ATPase subunit